MPSTKEFINQRDREIIEIINMLLEKGFTANATYEKVHYLTGLSSDYIKQVRFKKASKDS